MYHSLYNILETERSWSRDCVFQRGILQRKEQKTFLLRASRLMLEIRNLDVMRQKLRKVKRPAVARSRIQDTPLAWACSTCRGLVVRLLWLSGRALAVTAGLLTLFYFCLLYLSSFIKDNHAWWYRLPTVTTALTHDLWLLTEVTSAVFLQVKKSNHSYNHSYSLPLPFCSSLPPSNYLSIHPSCGYLCSDFAISGVT